MDDPILTIDEREAINTGRWFSSLSPSLRHDILRCAYVKRYKDGELIVARGEPPVEWIGLCPWRRARQFDLDLRQADHADLCGAGDLVWRRGDLRRRPAHPRCLCPWRNHAAVRGANRFPENSGPARGAVRGPAAPAVRAASASSTAWWKTSTRCRCAHGWPSNCCIWCAATACRRLSDGREVRIGLQLAQEELAQLLGASRQRVNQELKAMEREDAIRIEPGGLVVRDREALMRIVDADN